MSAFLDASVIVAVLTHEEDAEDLSQRLRAVEGQIYVSSVVVYEAAISIARKKAGLGRRPTPELISDAVNVVGVLLRAFRTEEVPLVGDVTKGAIDASARYGKVAGHPARLNMGDCFAYACARAKGVPLLYKGDDFALTDIASA